MLKPLLDPNQTFIFTCLNDQMDHSHENAMYVEEDLKINFYEKLFPAMSKFEIESEATVGEKSGQYGFIDFKWQTSSWYSFKAIYLCGTALFVLFLLDPIMKRLRNSTNTRVPK